VLSNTEKKIVHLGIAASVRRPNGDVVSYSRKPEINLASNFVNTGNIANANRVALFGLEALLSSGRFYAQAEGMASRIERTGGAGTAMLNGAYAFAGMFLTDDFRPYKAGNADRVIPTRNFDPRTDGWGAVAVTARVSTLDLTDSGINGGSMTDGTLGLSWYLNPNTSMKANYVLAKVKDFGTASAVQFRVQFDF
jgi:phosphate-selective porin OprO/OprP